MGVLYIDSQGRPMPYKEAIAAMGSGALRPEEDVEAARAGGVLGNRQPYQYSTEEDLRREYDKTAGPMIAEMEEQRRTPREVSSSGWEIRPRSGILGVQPFDTYKTNVWKRQKQKFDELQARRLKEKAAKTAIAKTEADTEKSKAEADEARGRGKYYEGYGKYYEGLGDVKRDVAKTKAWADVNKRPSSAEQKRSDELALRNFVGDMNASFGLKKGFDDRITSNPLTAEEASSIKEAGEAQGLNVKIGKDAEGNVVVVDVVPSGRSRGTAAVAMPPSETRRRQSSALFMYRDANGNVYAVDNPDAVPAEYRDSARTYRSGAPTASGEDFRESQSPLSKEVKKVKGTDDSNFMDRYNAVNPAQQAQVKANLEQMMVNPNLTKDQRMKARSNLHKILKQERAGGGAAPAPRPQPTVEESTGLRPMAPTGPLTPERREAIEGGVGRGVSALGNKLFRDLPRRFAAVSTRNSPEDIETPDIMGGGNPEQAPSSPYGRTPYDNQGPSFFDPNKVQPSTQNAFSDAVAMLENILKAPSDQMDELERQRQDTVRQTLKAAYDLGPRATEQEIINFLSGLSFLTQSISGTDKGIRAFFDKYRPNNRRPDGLL